MVIEPTIQLTIKGWCEMDEMIQFNYAGFWKRFVAFIIDQIAINIVTTILIIPFLLFFGLSLLPFTHLGEMSKFTATSLSLQNSTELVGVLAGIVLTLVLFSVASLILQWLYYALMESSSKQATLGKMALGIKVVDLNGDRVSFGKATGRYFGKIISGLILYIGFFMAGWTIKKQALHDIMAGCLVINQE